MKPLSRWLRQLTGVGSYRERATAVAQLAFAEPSESDVRWLDSLSASLDEDHARWELRYARRALFFHAARRDALSDAAPAAVAHAMEEALLVDPEVDVAKREIAFEQFNARLRAYGRALDEHDGRSQRDRLAETLLQLAGIRDRRGSDASAVADWLMKTLQEANEVLRAHFGAASLPEDLPPSAAAGARGAKATSARQAGSG